MKLNNLSMASRLAALVLVTIGLFERACDAATITYANPAGANDFTVGTNWVGNAAPGASDIVTINGVDGIIDYSYLDATRSIDRFTLATSNGNQGGLELRSGGNFTTSNATGVNYVGARGPAYLRIMNGSSITTSSTLNVGWGDGSGHGTGTVTQSGGSYTGSTTAGNITLGVAAADANFPASVGTYNLDSGPINLGGTLIVGMAGIGTFSMNGGSVTTGNFLQIGRTGTGTFTQTAGPLVVNRSSGDAMVVAAVAGATGKYEISGGSLKVTTTGTNAGVAIGVAAGTANGTFKIVGDAPTSVSITGDYKQFAGANLSLDIGAGITPINLTGNATLGGSLNVSFTATPSYGQQFIIMNYGGAQTGAFAFESLVDSPLGPNTIPLSISYGDGSADSVILTVVPEPTMFALCAGMLSAILLSRAPYRRKG